MRITTTLYRCLDCGAEATRKSGEPIGDARSWHADSWGELGSDRGGCSVLALRQVYTCRIGGHEWTREPKRGPQPVVCPEHGGGHDGAHKVMVACEACGELLVRSRAATYGDRRPSCGGDCRRAALRGLSVAEYRAELRLAALAKSTELVRYDPAAARWSWRWKPPAPSFTSLRCEGCGTFVVLVPLQGRGRANRFCSDRCARKDANARRRVKLRVTYVEPVSWELLWREGARDCHLCGELCDPSDFTTVVGRDGRRAFRAGPTYPTVDHLVPVSVGGEHSRANAALAHLRCNTVRGATPLAS